MAIILDLYPKKEETKAKINIWDLIKLKTFAQQRKSSTKQKITYWMEENICKQHDW